MVDEKLTPKERRQRRQAERRERRRAAPEASLDALAGEVEVVEEAREQAGELVEEVALAHGIEEEIDYSPENLSLEANLYLNDYLTYLNGHAEIGTKKEPTKTSLKGKFRGDLGSTLDDIGLMDTRLKMKKRGKQIFESTIASYDRYVHSLGRQFHIQLYNIDQEFQRELEAGGDEEDIRDKYDAKFAHLYEVTEAIAENYDITARAIIKVAGSQSGADNFIDAGSTWTELSEFNKNGRELLAEITPPDDLIVNAYEHPSFRVEEFDFEAMSDACSKSAAIIRKIHEGNDLDSADYTTVIDSIEAFFGHGFDTSSFGDLESSLGVVEQTGMMTAVYAMNPLQRYELGQRILDKYEPAKARDGIEFLTSTGILDIGQAQHLLEENIGALGMFTDQDIENIRHIRHELDQLRKHSAKTIKSNPFENLALEKFTASNGLLYEIVFRFAALGVILPFAFNITNPGGWGDIVTNPFWLGCVAVSGITLDHVTGGIGSGYTSQTIAGIGVKGETPEQADNRYEWAEFNRLLGDHPETTDYLTTENPRILEDIVLAASDSGNMGGYEFTFDGLIEDHLHAEMDRLDAAEPGMDEVELEEAARQSLENRYGVGLDSDLSGDDGDVLLDGYSRTKTEQVIADICDQLFRVKSIVTLEGAQDAFDESRERRILDT